jgi:hypothetical protein
VIKIAATKEGNKEKVGLVRVLGDIVLVNGALGISELIVKDNLGIVV